MGDFITAKEFAAQVNRSVSTLGLWDRKKIGPPRLKIGNRVLYRIDAAREWLLQREEQQNAER